MGLYGIHTGGLACSYNRSTPYLPLNTDSHMSPV